MQRLSQQQQDQRKQLYNQGLSDTAMAAQLNVKRATITAWRKRNNLPHNIPNSNVPMTQVLTPAQCQVMRTFLRSLVCLANTKPPGTELRIGKFMEAWRENVYNIRTKRQRPTPDNTP